MDNKSEDLKSEEKLRAVHWTRLAAIETSALLIGSMSLVFAMTRHLIGRYPSRRHVLAYQPIIVVVLDKAVTLASGHLKVLTFSRVIPFVVMFGFLKSWKGKVASGASCYFCPDETAYSVGATM